MHYVSISKQKEVISLEMESLKCCPLCGARITSDDLEKLGIASEMLTEIQRLKEQGMLSQAILIAVKIVKTVNDKPMWFKELLDETREDLRDDFQKENFNLKNEIRKEFRELLKILMQTIGNPLKTGRIQEETIPKRLKAVKPEDNFSTEKSTRRGEDITCIVKENNEVLGKIIVESKKVKKWSNSFIEQIKRYMEKQNTEFGIIATTAMPSDALSYTTIIEGVIVVQIDHIEPAYLFLREYLALKKVLEKEHATKIKQLEVKDQVLLELKQAISDGKLDEIITTVNGLTESIDTSVNKADVYVNNLFKRIKKDTGKIRNLMAKLVNDHIEKAKLQLGIQMQA